MGNGRRILLALVCLLLGAVGNEASAATYNFSWTGNPTSDPSLVSAGDPTASATGTLELSALPGESFTISNLLGINIAVTGSAFPAFSVTWLQFLSGTISADGLTASLTDFFYNDDGAIFGCVTPKSICAADPSGANIRIVEGKKELYYGYTTSANALSSFHLTSVSAVPIPAALPLLGIGLAFIGAMNSMRRRSRRA